MIQWLGVGFEAIRYIRASCLPIWERMEDEGKKNKEIGRSFPMWRKKEIKEKERKER